MGCRAQRHPFLIHLPRSLTMKLFSFDLIIALVGVVVTLATTNAYAADPLPSWNDGKVKESIIDFVEKVTKEGSSDFVAANERIATFDNDGTLWSEQPIYFQLQFAMDRVKQLAPQHPEWKSTQPFQAVLENDQQAILDSGERGLIKLVMATHANMTTDQFAKSVKEWIATAKHPRFGRPYPELVFQPMLELLKYLRVNQFKTYIVSGGGVEFVRVFAEEVYGIPPEQVIGSTIKTKFEMRDEIPVLIRIPEVDFINDKAGKPVAINKFIGVRPIAAFGNSDGDLQMLQWTAAGDGVSLQMVIHHTDAKREWAYDRDSHIGKLDELLNQAKKQGWSIANMQLDWKIIYPTAKSK